MGDVYPCRCRKIQRHGSGRKKCQINQGGCHKKRCQERNLLKNIKIIGSFIWKHVKLLALYWVNVGAKRLNTWGY
jgi:hypothetical protein